METFTDLLTVNDLAVQFSSPRGTMRAVRGVDFVVGRGETLALVGESGSGKTASALALLSLLPPNARTISGRALFEGSDLLQLDERSLEKIRGRRVAVVYQDPLSALNPVLTVGRQLTEAMERHLNLTRQAAAERAVELLEVVGLPDPSRALGRYPHQFSGGMRQRVLIASAISCRPSLVIADEPTTALDVTIQAQILELLARLRAEMQLSLLLITHNLGIVAGMADRVAVMYAGRFVEHGSVQVVLEEPAHPYTAGLIASVPRMDTPRSAPLRPIPGSPPDAATDAIGCSYAPRCPLRLPVCDEQRPDLDLVGPAHWAACWASPRLRA